MKKNLVVFLFLINISSVFSQSLHTDIFQIKPKRFSIYETPNGEIGYCLSGSGPYVMYDKPVFEVNIPEILPEKEQIPYVDLLFSGIYSLLYEYKNYDGLFPKTSLSVFALGNYRDLSNEVLEILNKTILPNRSYLETIYQWVKPYYIKTFNSLTYKEQKTLLIKLNMAERYVLNVLKEKNEKKYEDWLLKNEYEPDEKLVGFLQRRIDKKQWKIADCDYWINELKVQFTPLLKNKDFLNSHYQVTDVINDKYMIACNHAARYYIMDKKYNKLYEDEFLFIQLVEGDTLMAYPEINYKKFQKFTIDKNGDIQKVGN
ncbi:MAG: hypothetical protein RLZZ417_1647 [Bacteroidota bacterium]|jgi:hypothetical protein